ncbi:regulatory protein GemA [Parvibaculaceae bacterium PLY_AMNH_Bact1]|nr:regulatory protein GemA [Parvibaculaceae bacterium PLY_AMNH_Bact1]
MSALPERRTQLIRLVHIAKKQRKLDDETYRDLLERETGLRSAGDMTDDQLEKVMAAFRAQGFKTKRQQRTTVKHDQGRFIVALWIDLWQLGAVEDRRDAALDAFVKRQTGVERMLWLSPRQANSVVEALKDWCKREGLEIVYQAGDPDPGLTAKRAVCHAIFAKLALYEDGQDGFAMEMDYCNQLDAEKAQGLANRMAYRLHALKKLVVSDAPS